ncbi:MAG: hypothetical protein SGI87_11215 [Flavobacteriales bacterium]|nr:hypothetical protein [Flavobacteriales bacterium]
MAKPKKDHINIFKFRVIIDAEEDIFRDIEISTDDHFFSLHRAILDAFDFEDGEMASFYMSDENWEKGLEIPLMDMGASELSMAGSTLSDFVDKPADKILYVYDFLRMWCFYVELIEVKMEKPSTIYPRVALAYGDAPSQDSKEMDLYGTEMDDQEFDDTGDEMDNPDDREENDIFDDEDLKGSYSDDDSYY